MAQRYLPMPVPGRLYEVLMHRIREAHAEGRVVPCTQGPDPDLWYEEMFETHAKALCTQCPVVVECGRHALVADELGVWGAMSQRERRNFAKRRPRAASI